MKLMNMKVFKFAIIGKPILFSKMDRSKYNLSKGSHLEYYKSPAWLKEWIKEPNLVLFTVSSRL